MLGAMHARSAAGVGNAEGDPTPPPRIPRVLSTSAGLLVLVGAVVSFLGWVLDRPQLGPVATGLGEVFHYLGTGEGKSLAELRTVQDWIVKPQLRSVPGVAEINTWGGRRAPPRSGG